MLAHRPFRRTVFALLLTGAALSLPAQVQVDVERDDTRTYAALLAEREATGTVSTDPETLIVTHERQRDVRVATVTFHSTYGEMDIYYPPDHDFDAPLPAVIFANYYPDNEYRKGFGVSYRESRLASDWASYLAAHGFAAVLYATGQPFFSAKAAVTYVADHAQGLTIDAGRLGMFGASANAQTALQLLSKADIPAVSGVRAVAIVYPTTMGYALPAHRPRVLVVRAGKDRADFLRDVDRAVERLEDGGYEVTLIRYDDGVHAFDTRQDTPRSREIIQEVVRFFDASL